LGEAAGYGSAPASGWERRRGAVRWKGHSIADDDKLVHVMIVRSVIVTLDHDLSKQG
jgi:hypothetical protein